MTPGLALFLAVVAAAVPSIAGAGEVRDQRGLGQTIFVDPLDAWTCPASHPIKAVVTPRTRECVYHLPGSMHYPRTQPQMCFASEGDAKREECWRAEEVL